MTSVRSNKNQSSRAATCRWSSHRNRSCNAEDEKQASPEKTNPPDGHGQAAALSRLQAPHPDLEASQAEASPAEGHAGIARRASPQAPVAGVRSTHASRQKQRRAPEAQEQGDEARQGLLGRAEQALEGGQRGDRAGGEVRVSRSPLEKGRVPPPLDHADQRRGPAARPVLQQVHERAAQSGRRGEPESPRRSGRAGSGGV